MMSLDHSERCGFLNDEGQANRPHMLDCRSAPGRVLKRADSGVELLFDEGSESLISYVGSTFAWCPL